MTESEFTKKFTDGLKKATGSKVIVLGAHKRSQAGLPDRLVVARAAMFFLEFKLCKGKLSPLQSAVIEDLNHVRPASAFVLRKADDTSTTFVLQDVDGETILRGDLKRRADFSLLLRRIYLLQNQKYSSRGKPTGM